MGALFPFKTQSRKFTCDSNPALIFSNDGLIFMCYNTAINFREEKPMTNFEKVEKLCEKANVTYEEAKAALEATEWDLLEAIVLLEQQGKVNKNSAHHSTKSEPAEEPERESRDSFSTRASRVLRKLARIIQMGNDNHLVISRKGECLLTVPVTVLVILLLFTNVFLLIAMAVGLFCGLRYSFKGEQLGRDSVNDAMKKAADMADCVRESVQEEFKH